MCVDLSGREGKQSGTVPGSAKCSQLFQTCGLLCFQGISPATVKKKILSNLSDNGRTEDSNTLAQMYLTRGVSSELMHIISIILEITIILGGYLIIIHKTGHYTVP